MHNLCMFILILKLKNITLLIKSVYEHNFYM